MANTDLGYVYILTNPSFKEDWVKIGKSSRPVDVRSKELDNTAVPLPFEIYATLKTCKYDQVEKLVHKTIDRLTDLRIRQNREFFNVAPAVAMDILKDIATTIDDAVLEQYINGAPVQVYPQNKVPVALPATPKKPQRPPFKFSMAGISIGTKIVFDPANIEVEVATEDKIEYEGRLWSLSAFTGTYMPDDKKIASGAYQGPKFFSYKGKSMLQLRDEKGN